MTNLDAIKKIAANLGGDAKHCRTNAEALNVVAENVASPSGSSGGVWERVTVDNSAITEEANNLTLTITAEEDGTPLACKCLRAYNAYTGTDDLDTTIEVHADDGKQLIYMSATLPSEQIVEFMALPDSFGGTFYRARFYDDYNGITTKETSGVDPRGAFTISKISLTVANKDDARAFLNGFTSLHIVRA